MGTCSVRTADGVPRTAAILYSLGNFSNDADDRVEVESRDGGPCAPRRRRGAGHGLDAAHHAARAAPHRAPRAPPRRSGGGRGGRPHGRSPRRRLAPARSPED
ncbi:MAG: hypothetical protein R3F43_09680 [bacterium]